MERSLSEDELIEIERLAALERRKVNGAIAKEQRLIRNLKGDLEKHGDPERWKRYGDLLLANIGTAKRSGNSIVVTDYFDEAVPEIEIEGESNKSLTEVAEQYFTAYTKARNARTIVAERLAGAEERLKAAQASLTAIDSAVQIQDIEFLRSLQRPAKPRIVSRPSKKEDQSFKGARRFLSSEGYEILVGKKAGDNDFLTFRIARSLDMWLHAADYPGSHVVVRSAGKKPVPEKTLVEAAQLAAFYSDAREQPKAAVRYTQKRFVNRIKGGAPGLVRLASFRTLMVEPKVAVELIPPR